MAIEVITEFIAGGTVKATAYIYDEDDELDDPDAVVITITDADGDDQVDEAVMTKDSTGIYTYYYNTSSSSATGPWSVLVKATDGVGDGAKVSHGTASFTVV